MTETDAPLVVARIKSDKLEFTTPAPFTELFKAVNQRCPVDKVYFVISGPTGYAYREAGEFVLQFHPASEAPQIVEPHIEPESPPQEAISLPPTPTPKVEEKAPPKSKSRPKKEIKASPGTLVVDGFIPGQDPPKGQPDPHSHLRGDFWK